MAKPYNPADEIAKYNKIVQDRGYDFFSSQAMAAHKEKYGDKATGDIVSEAREKHAAFQEACNNINHRDHAEAHDTLMTKFGGDQKAALEDFKNEELRKNGRLPEQYPIRNTNYEKKTLDGQKPAKNASMEEQRQWATLRSILEAKWKAVGYEADGREILRFNTDYTHKVA